MSAPEVRMQTDAQQNRHTRLSLTAKGEREGGRSMNSPFQGFFFPGTLLVNLADYLHSRATLYTALFLIVIQRKHR